MRDLVDAVAERTGIERPVVETAARALFGIVEERLGCGEAVAIRGFGRFEIFVASGRPGRNFATGEALPGVARARVRFRPGARVRRLLTGVE